MLQGLQILTTAQEFLDHYQTVAELLEAPARIAHEGWRETKRAAFQDPSDPYRGYGPVRIKVRDLAADERAVLGDVQPSADVYHPLDRPYDEVDADTRNKNVVPMVVLCNALGDIVLPPNSELAVLEHALEQFVTGADTQLVGLLARIQHLGFLTSEARSGARPFGDEARDDFRLHGFLPRPVQELDVVTLRPVAEWLLAELRNPRQLALTLGQIDGRRLRGDFTWEQFHVIMHHPDFTNLGKENDVSSTTPAEPGFWATVERAFTLRASGVEQVFYQGTDEDGKHRIGVVVYDLDSSTAGEVGSVITVLRIEHGIDAVLGDVRGATTRRVLPAGCPTCGVPWSFCRNPHDHRYDARQAAVRRL
jgi:hypothetical protein